VASGQPPARRLVLLRHAKSQWPDGVPDQDRPLAERGIADATAAGPVLAGFGTPDVVLCSPALRTRQTWRLVSAALTDPPAPRFDEGIYGAGVRELLDLIRDVPVQARLVVIVGHEPTMSATTDLLAGPGSRADDLARLRNKYPTSGMAVLRPTTDWADLTAESAALERFLVPRG
jgi:phosphohistidine phosphatase